ncbi:MAG: MaoC family dehydratase [Burkholderiaceae bacterium]
MTTPAPRYAFEDFEVGRVIACGPRTVTAEEIIAFAKQFDPQAFHVDEEAGKQSIYGSLIASGWHTAAMVMRMGCDAYLLDSTSVGSPGVDELRWLKPTRAGDTIRADLVTLEVRPSRSKPDRGIVVSEWRVYNQHDELIMTMRGMGLFLRRGV